MNSRSPFRVAVVLLIFFVVSLLTNVTGPLVPDVIQSFKLNLTMVAFLPFSFFAAYALMSVPSGVFVEKWGEKVVLLGAFALAFAGAFLFCLRPAYSTALLSLFTIGLGMAAIQVAINPLLRVSGGEEHYAFFAVLAQFVFGAASFLSPLLYSHFAVALGPDALAEADGLTRWMAEFIPKNLPWIAVYWIFSGIAALMILVVWAVDFPRVERQEDERTGALDTHLLLLRQPVVWLYFVGIFSYVGLEQGLANWMSQFLAVQHGLNPKLDGAAAVSNFWGFMTIGCLFGLVLLKFLDSRKVLLVFSIVAILSLTLALHGTRESATIAFSMVGFAISVMWSIIFSLALNSIPKHHGTFSGILCTGIVGGALIPLLIGGVGDQLGLRSALCLLYLPLFYIFSIGLWAKPLIKNKTVLCEN